MAVTVTINSVDRTKNVQWRSMRVENVVTNKMDTARFDILYESVNRTFQPTLGHVVNIKDGATTIFEGPVVSVDEVPMSAKSILYKIVASDYTRFLDRKLVVESYTNMKVQDIIADIITTYAPDFTTTNVDSTFTADKVQFNYENVSDCLKQLADLTGQDWYVDENKDVHFFSKEIVPAPFSLSDGSANWDTNSLIIRRDNSQIRNQIVVRGSEFIGSRFTASIEATGVDAIYPLAYRYSEFAVTLTGQPLNVGIDNVDDADDYDVTYNFQEKIIRFREARKPSVGSEIRVSGKPYIPVIVKLSDKESQNSIGTAEGGSGIYEDLIIDKTIESKQAARDRARAEIDKYKETLVEAQFTSKTSGLRAGQEITLNITSRNVNASYIISKVVYTMWTPTAFQYDVSLITTKTYGMLEWMMTQLREGKKQIEINPDEVLDTVEAVTTDELSIAETVTAVVPTSLSEAATAADTFTAFIDSPPTWVAGKYHPTSLDADRKRPGFTDRDNFLRI